MKGLVLTDKGIEDIAVADVKQIIKKKAAARTGCVTFDFDKFEEFFRLIYLCQSASKILALIGSFEFDDLDSITSALKDTDFSAWLKKDTTFRVSCRKSQEYSFSSDELCMKAGEAIIDGIEEKKKYRQKVDLDNPDVIVYLYLESNICYCGIDLAGIELDKREYRVFLHPSTVKGTVAYSLVRLSGFDKAKTFLDPFARCGEIPLEAALFAAGKSVHHYSKNKFLFARMKKFEDIDFDDFFNKIDTEQKPADLKIVGYDSQLKSVTAAKKNAKIAGIQKQVEFSRVDIDWLDTKFKESSVDCIAAKLPHIQDYNEKAIRKVLKEFFYQAEFILAKDGAIAAATQQPKEAEEILKEYKLSISEQRKIFQGKEEFTALIIKKS